MQPALSFRGGWSATAGPRVFRGTWSGRAVRDQPDAAEGEFTVVNERNQIVLQGTWSATKAARRWDGRWSARLAAGRRGADDVLTGTWSRPIAGNAAMTLAEMLQQTLTAEVTGAWRSGRSAGAWRLSGRR